MLSPLQLLTTKDGSPTLFNSSLGAAYHNTNGAVTESRLINIEYGLCYVQKIFGNELTVLEIGFGTALNAALSADYAATHHLTLKYIAVDNLFLDASVFEKLDYSAWMDVGREEFFALHRSPLNSRQKINGYFFLTKINSDIRDYVPQEKFHLVYFDAFAPADSPEMWTKEVFEKIYEAMHPGAALVTYCAKGSVKRLLKSTGFVVESLAGPPGKKEVTRAMKI